VTKGIEVVSLRAASSLKERNRPQVPAAEDLINRLDQQGTEVPVLEIMAPRAKRCTHLRRNSTPGFLAHSLTDYASQGVTNSKASV
jgi:hypothetical protein